MERRRLVKAGRDMAIQMSIAGQSPSAVSEALATSGYGTWSPDHIRRHYAGKPEVVKAVEEARALAVSNGVADKSQRVEALWKRAQWVEAAIEKLNVSDPQPAILKTLLSEFREYSKQVAQELGEWQERKDVTSGGRPISFDLSVLSTEELEMLGQLRSKLRTGA